MALFNLPNRVDKSGDKRIAKKAVTTTKAPKTVKGGAILGRINEIKAMVEKNLGKYKDDYVIIREPEQLSEYLSHCIKNRVISIDTETSGLDPLQDTLVGICIYTPKLPAAYIPLNHISYVTGVKASDQLDMKLVKEEFERIIQEHIDIIMFNAKFDMRFLRNQLGLREIYCTWDCYLAAKLMNENEPTHGLKALHRKYVLQGKGDAFSFDELFKRVSFDKIPVQTGYLYAAHDAVITYEFYEYQKQYVYYDPTEGPEARNGMNGVSWVFFNIEMPCIEVVADMEDAGICLDIEYASELAEKYNDMLKEIEERFYKQCDKFGKQLDAYRAQQGAANKLEYPINISSSSQIAIMLYDVLEIKPPEPKSPRGTGEEILEKIDHPIAKIILEYRGVKKLLTTYIEKLPECVNPQDGRVHCSFNQYGAVTGRFSSSDPNLQNIPSHNKDVRKMFVAAPGCVLMSSDYSQQEPKVMTQMCGDKKMLDAYRHGKDLYAQIAAIAFNTEYENCLEFRPDGTTNKEGKERRSSAKSILLGILYGRGIKSVAEQLHTTKAKAQEIQDKIFKGFPAIPKFEADSKQMAVELGYVTTLWGRKRRLPALSMDEYEFSWKDGAPPDDDLLDFDDDFLNAPEYEEKEVPEDIKEKYLRKLSKTWGSQKRPIFEQAAKEGIKIVDNGGKIADAERQVVNSRIQGSAADMSKLAMILVGKDAKLRAMGFRLLIPVHDELIAECPEKNAKEAAERFAMLMSKAAESRLTVPISCDVEITRQWYGERVEI